MNVRNAIRLLSTPNFVFSCFCFLFSIYSIAQDFPYPQSPENRTTIFTSDPSLQWKGSDQFLSYTLQIYEADYIAGNNFNSINLHDYELKYAYEGDAGYEASGLTYHELRENNFITIDDQYSIIYSFNNSFNLIGSGTLNTFQNEGITYLYDDFFASVEEHTSQLSFIKFNYRSNNTLSSINKVNKVATNSGNNYNNGFEGITYNPINNKMYLVKEKQPMAFYEFNAPTAPNFREPVTLSQPFIIRNAQWAPADLAGLYHLSLNKNMAATKAGEHILLLSEESSVLLEIDLKGNLISEKEMDIEDLPNVNNDDFFKAEGIAYNNGTIWVASEGRNQTPAIYYGFVNENHQNPRVVIKSEVYQKENLTATTYRIEDCLLKNNTSYCWKVIAKKLDGTRVESTYYHFRTQFQAVGCLDENACNFDACATRSDNSCEYGDCLGICGGNNQPGGSCSDGFSNTTGDYLDDNCNCIGKGCTDRNACNYNPNAKEDNGTCLQDDCWGFCGGNRLAGSSCNDGHASTTGDYYNENCVCIGRGCTDRNACNFNPNAKEDDGSCTKRDCRGICGGSSVVGTSCTISSFNDGLIDNNCNCLLKGCKDINACNYNPLARLSDGSCEYMNAFTGICYCQPNVIHSALNRNYRQRYYAKGELTSAINIFTAKDITYYAGKSVTLNSGFRINSKANLTIEIESCTP